MNCVYSIQIYRKSLDESEVPDRWKEAEIVLIHKGGSKAVMASFHLVALTSIVCKVLAFLVTNTLISQRQQGFVRDRSCQTHTLLCLERWTDMVDSGKSGKSVYVAYFVYAKAFDKVSHRLLLI